MRSVQWVRARDAAGRVLALPSQTPGLRHRLGLTRAQTDRELWVMDRAGRFYPGPAGVNVIFRELGGRLALAGRLLALPGIHRLEHISYHTFARYRGCFSRWGLMPPCEEPGAECLDAPVRDGSNQRTAAQCGT